MDRREGDDADQVRRARSGDVSAYEELVRTHQAAAIRLAHVVGGSADDAPDIAQVAFVKAYGALDRFRDGASFRTWVLAIVANEARNHRRSAGRRAHYELRLAHDPVLSPVRAGDRQLGPEQRAIDREAHEALALALAALPERQREVVACRYLLELSVEETAAVLDLRPGTVKSHLSRALERLRQEVATDG